MIVLLIAIRFKMATNFLPSHEDFFNELQNDDDSDFEGFDINNSQTEDTDSNSDDSESETIGNNATREWNIGSYTPDDLRYTRRPGISVALPDAPTPLDYLNLFIKNSDFDTITEQTNLYAEQYLRTARLKPKSRFHNWKDTTKDEMKVFTALIIAMGLVHQQDISEYWTTDPVTETPFFRTCMSRDRFSLLMSFLHLNDNTNYRPRGTPGYVPLFKLGQVYQNVIQRFASVYTPHQYLSIDEGMIPWRGHLSFKVYNPDKPHKYGIKAYMVCDSVNGYCTKYKLYTGKSDAPVSYNGATYDIVMDMMRNYFGVGHKLYMDNYYSSPILYSDLFELGIGATGTLRSNRKGVPQVIKEKKLKEKGEIFVVNLPPLMLAKYNDRKVVHLLTTIDSVERIPSGHHDPRNAQPVLKPNVVLQYNRYMGGVDRSDQMVSYSSFKSRTIKWWKRVFFNLLNLAILNSYILYKETTADPHPLLQRMFRRKLVHCLIASAGKLPSSHVPRGRPSTSTESIVRLTDRHFPERIVAVGKKKNITRSCVVCVPAERELLATLGEKRKRPGRESSYRCAQCKCALCVEPCFKIYHTYEAFKLAYKRLKNAEDTSDESD